MSIKFDYFHIVFPYDDTLSVRGTTIVSGKNRQESPLSLYQPAATLLRFLPRKLNKNLAENEVTYYEIRSSVLCRYISAVERCPHFVKCFDQKLGECKVHVREIQVSLQKKSWKSTLVTADVLVKYDRECLK